MVIAATMCVLVFNSGESELARIQREFALDVGKQTIQHAKKKDKRRSGRKVVSSSKRKARAYRHQTEIAK